MRKGWPGGSPVVVGVAVVALLAGCTAANDTSAPPRVLAAATRHAEAVSAPTVAATAPSVVSETVAAPTPQPQQRHIPLVLPGTVGHAPGTPKPLPVGAVALTFDDGPDPTWTPRVLAVLARYDASATFFDIGLQAQRYPQLVRAEWAAGMGVGNHTWSHPDLTRLTPAQLATQIGRAADVIASDTGGQAPVCLRPPYDAVDLAVQRATDGVHESLMLYDVDPRDWSRPGVAAIVHRVLAAARPGMVVDLHDAGGNRSQTVAALPLILQGLAARHLTTVRICRGRARG